MLVDSYSEFIDDKGLKMAAALSYFTAFSIGPFLLIIISVVGLFFGEDKARIEIVSEVNKLIGSDGANMVNTIIKGASNISTGIISAIVSIALLILGAIGVFIELQESLNIIWGVELKPGRGLRNFIRTRLVSFSMVIASSFVLMVSLIVDSALSAFQSYLSNMFPKTVPLAEIFNIVSSFFVITLIFALIYRFLPDVIISWKYVWTGAIITSFLFSVGKYLISIYMGTSAYASTYGAAASLVILFVWIYYSGVILYLGAEITYIYRLRYGVEPIKADKEALIVPKVAALIKRASEKARQDKEDFEKKNAA